MNRHVRTIAIIATTATLTALIVQPDTIVDTVTVTDTVHVPTSIDLQASRQVPAKSPVDDQLDMECAYALQRITDEPLMGILLYVERWWNGNACDAYQHQVEHGWY